MRQAVFPESGSCSSVMSASFAVSNCKSSLRAHAQRGAFICARGGACRAEEYALSTAGATPRQEAESAASVHTTATAPSSTRAALPGGGLRVASRDKVSESVTKSLAGIHRQGQ